MNLLKRPAVRSQAIRDAAKGEDCTMQSWYCNHNPETTVAAHSNLGSDGKGGSLKASDIYVAFLCSDCHTFYDGPLKGGITRAERQEMFHEAMKKTWRRLVELGIIRIGAARG